MKLKHGFVALGVILGVIVAAAILLAVNAVPLGFAQGVMGLGLVAVLILLVYYMIRGERI